MLDWTVYWFMLPICIVIASVAMFSGISGAAPADADLSLPVEWPAIPGRA